MLVDFLKTPQFATNCFKFCCVALYKMRRIYLFSLSLSQTEALTKTKQQPRQIQTSNSPTLPQHALRGPAGSASATPTSSAHGPVHVLPGSYVAARSTAASLPALTRHTVSVFARERAHRMPRRYRNSSFHHYQLWKFLTLYQLHKRSSFKSLRGGERNKTAAHPRRSSPPAKSTRGVT